MYWLATLSSGFRPWLQPRSQGLSGAGERDPGKEVAVAQERPSLKLYKLVFVSRVCAW